MFPKRILLSGGGIRGLAHIGALLELEKRGLLCVIKEWAGVSAGSILALMLVVGYTLNELKNFCEQFDFSHIIDLDDATSMFLKFGMDTGEKMKRLLEALLKEKGIRADITFDELMKLNLRTQQRGQTTLRVYATDLNTGLFQIFSANTTPSYSVVEAVRASSSIPVYFQPSTNKLNGNILVDGGVISNFPIHYLTEQERKETLGLNLKKKVVKIDELEPADFFIRPIIISMSAHSKLEGSLYLHNTITIETNIVNPLLFNLTATEKDELFKEGQQAVINYLEHQKPPRRWSVS